jgi:hypothetical protein
VAFAARRQLELREDPGHVLLDGAFGDHQLLGDRRVGAALGHQPEHLALARRQLLQRVLAATVVPAPGLLCTSKLPSSVATRSSRPRRPPASST